jgi:preprotein translocase subunit SecE
MNLATYLKDTLSELRQVRWPTRQATIKLTGIVIGISLLVGIYIGLLDYAFTHLLTFLFK